MKLAGKKAQTIRWMGCSLLLVGSILVAPTVHAFNRVEVIKTLQSVSANWQDSEIDVWINDLKGDPDPGVLIGESVRFSVESDVPSYFLLTFVDAKGETTLISDDTVSRTLEFPPRSSEEVLEQAPPLGAQNVFVFASKKAFNLDKVGITPTEQMVTLPKDIGSIERVAALLNRHGEDETLAMAPRYTYFVDNPNVKLSTRGLKRKLTKQMERVGGTPPIFPTLDPVPVDPAPVPVDPAIASSVPNISLDIKFEYNSAVLGDQGIAQLEVVGDALVALLETDSLPRISLEGHTDDMGPAEYNMKLSDQRARSARTYLIDNFGIPEDSIDAFGMGESSPMVTNRDKTSRALNRRVELRVVR